MSVDKIQITRKQAEQFNRMLKTLREIAGTSKGQYYMTTDQLRRDAEKDGFHEYEDLITMTYDNIQGDAKNATNGVRAIGLNSTFEPPIEAAP